MNTLKLASPFALPIENFIRLRQLCGRDYRSQGQLLGHFDRFLVQEGVKNTRITRPIIERYQRALSHLAPRGQANRMGVVRQLCQYLVRDDPNTFIAEPMKTIWGYRAGKPYIFSCSEIGGLMDRALELPPAGSREPHIYHTLLGLLYTTGIRISEALALNLDSFDVSKQCLYIAQGKFRKARWIALSDSASKKLQCYIDQRLDRTPNAQQDALFLTKRGQRLSYNATYRTFRSLLDQCGIAYHKRTGPRLHDLRHTFAVHRLLGWYQDGLTINALLPILATYMGHVNIRSTQVYLQPTAELLEQVSNRFHEHYLRTVASKGDRS